MVYVNNKKFACESCVKGHRSSSCIHTDRPLFEIKKKGRPVSQCQTCRQLRQTRKKHNKCTCNEVEEATRRAETLRLLANANSKQKRYIPIVPALPNGLQDVLVASSSESQADSRQKVDTLLNPCNCKSVWKCNCRSRDNSHQIPRRGLDALVRAAGIQQLAESDSTLASASRTGLYSAPGCCSLREKQTSTPPSGPGCKRLKNVARASWRGPDLPPILFERPSLAMPDVTIPDFEIMPPMSTIASLAGSGCTCGLQCACPGCVEHRGAEHASKERRDCTDGCGTCVDHSLGHELPGIHDPPTNAVTDGGANFLDRFFACAATLPAPPPNRRVELDPMDVTVYPGVDLVVGGMRGLAFGLVSIPKLECCGGRCGCDSEGAMCGCGKTCVGCCGEKVENRSLELESD